MKRTFIAIKIPLSRQAAEIFGDIKLKLKDEKIKWVDLWNMHLTLYFLGDIEEEAVPQISKELSKNLRGFKSFKLKSKGVGVFKNMKDARALWFGLEQNSFLDNLKQKVDVTLNKFGFETENKKFKPHITLGRVKYLKNTEYLRETIEYYSDILLQEIEVNSVIFYESKLTPKGPVYSILNKIELS